MDLKTAGWSGWNKYICLLKLRHIRVIVHEIMLFLKLNVTCNFRGQMYVIIGSHFVPLEGMFLLIALVIVRITLYNYGLHEKLITLSRCNNYGY